MLRLFNISGLCILAVLCSRFIFAQQPTIVHFDFEEGTLQGWRVAEGEFFEPVCARKTFYNNPGEPYNKHGEYFLSTLDRSEKGTGDPMTGVIESPIFVLQGSEASFLIGGGSHENTYAALCAENGDELLQARGRDAEVMQRIVWNVSNYMNQRVYLKVVDTHQGGWGHITFDDFRTEGSIDPTATQAHFAQREQLIQNKKLSDFQQQLQTEITAVRSAIHDLIDTFKDGYPDGNNYLAELDSFETKLTGLTYEDIDSIRLEFGNLRFKALTANPLVNAQPILYTVRPQYLPDHHSTATMFQNGEINTASFRGGGALKTIHFGQGGIVQTLIDAPQGIVRDPEVNFDGTSILISMRHNKDDDYHIYELDLLGAGSRQLTYGSQLSDIDPMYLPDGDIVFVSTREPKVCQCNRHIMGNLFRMESNGANLLQIGHNTLFEGHPAMLPDGRILYDRWEYVDKHFGPAFGLWTVNPDGTNHAVYYGNNAWSPGAIVDARPIPGTQWAVATFGSCHDRPWGAIVVVDRRLGLNGQEPVMYSWPKDINKYLTDNRDYGQGKSRNHPTGGQIDNFRNIPLKYEDPYPLSEKYFLCSHVIEGERTGIFLLDTFGNELLLHTEGAGCFDPMPIAPRPRPPVIPSRIDYASAEGHFYVNDVYIGSDMERVARGTIKYLRVVEAPVKLFWTQPNWNLDATQAPAMNFNCTNNKRILGTIPVESDGSAYFSVPADKFVYFQLLDENKMMVQSMRSGTTVLPGETLGCVGCHENRLTTIGNRRSPLALRRPPARLEPWYGDPHDFNYLTDVQPVFDEHCVQCHDYDKKAGKVLNLSGDLGLAFNTSYLELRAKSALRWFPDSPGAEKLLVKAVDDGPAEALPPYSWGSHRSKLADVIRSGDHFGVQLDPESLDRIITWIDLNAPYYGSYASVYPDNAFGRSPLNDKQLERLRTLTGVNVGDISTELQGSQVDFTRPEHSLCLQGLMEKDLTKYREAIDIIQAGQAMLALRPRMDMPGAQLLCKDQMILEKYRARMKAESEARMAVLNRPQHRIKSVNPY